MLSSSTQALRRCLAHPRKEFLDADENIDLASGQKKWADQPHRVNRTVHYKPGSSGSEFKLGSPDSGAVKAPTEII